MYFSKVYFICEPGIELWPILGGAGGRIYSRLTTFDHTSPLAGGHMNKNPCDSLLGGTMLKFFAQRTFIAQYWHWQVADIFTQMTLNCLRFLMWTFVFVLDLRKVSVLDWLTDLFVCFGLGDLFVCLFLALVIWGRPRPAANLNRGIEADKPPASSTHQYQWYHSLVGHSVRSFICLFGSPCLFVFGLHTLIYHNIIPASSTHQYQWYHSLVGLSVRLFVCLVVCLVLSVCLFLVFDNVHIHAYPTITYHTSNQHP